MLPAFGSFQGCAGQIISAIQRDTGYASLRAAPDSKGSRDCATSNQSLLRPLSPFSRFLGK
jgi:hypothetical protein